MDLNKSILEILDKQVKDGSLEKVLEGKVTKFIDSAVDSIFRYSDFSKAFEKKLQDELSTSLSTFSLDQYNKIIMDTVQKRVKEEYVQTAVDRFDKSLKDLFQVPPEEYKLSTFVENLMEGEEVSERYGSEITLIVDGDGKSSHISIDMESDKKSFECEYKLFVYDNKLISYEEDRYNRKNVIQKVFAGSKQLGSIESKMFQMIIHGTKFIVDEDDIDTTFGDC